MNKDGASSLDRLVDIVDQAPIPAWPPAPGWWIVAAAALLFFVVIILLWMRRRHRAAYRREALREIDRMGDDLRALPALLKRVALCAYPREQVAGLNGTAWVDFLNARTARPGFDESLLQLAYAPTAPAGRKALLATARRWILTHDPAPRC